MADGAHRRPRVPLFEGGGGVQVAASVTALVMLLAGLVGYVLSLHALSALGLFLFALFGFGSAALIALGVRGWRLVALSSPLGMALVLIAGALMVNLGVWVVGVPLYWLLAGLSAAVHILVVRGALQNGTLSVSTLRSGLDDFGRLLAAPSGIVGSRRRRPSGASIELLLVVIGFLACLISALNSRHLDPSWGGLLGAISPAWYVGLALIMSALFIGQRHNTVLAALPVIALQLVLTGTPAVVYGVPRYAWTAKHVGITSYILLHGSVNPSLDIYQAWPGLFSGVAWLCKVSNLAGPLGVARWWPPLIDLATVLVIQQLASRVLRDPRRAWFAATIFVVGYAIGDADYYSPQSAGFLMAMGTFAVVFRHRDERPMMSTASWLILFSASVANAVSHQLTPYMVTIVLVVLVVCKRANTRWAPIISASPPVAWALAHYSYVHQNVSWWQLLNPFANFLTPGITVAGPSPGTLANVVRLCQGGSALMIGILALAAMAKHRTGLNMVLATCAASGALLVLVNSYGNEASFRVVLFALPWLAILGASLKLTPRRWSEYLSTIFVALLLPVYLAADMGLDFVYAMRSGDVNAITQYEKNAPVGSYLVVIGVSSNIPLNVTGRYNLVNKLVYPYVLGPDFAHPIDAVASYNLFMSKFFSLIRAEVNVVIGTSPQFYVLTARQPSAYMAAYNFASLKQYSAFEQQFASSPTWKMVLRTSTAQLFELQRWPGKL